MTEIIFIGGTHLFGKTTIAKRLAARLQNAGHTIYYYPEMSYATDIPHGTIEWQQWLKQQIEIRDSAIYHLVDKGYDTNRGDHRKVDYIIADRHVSDVDIYTLRMTHSMQDARLLASWIKRYPMPSGHHHYIISRQINSALGIASERITDETFRWGWNETDLKYLMDIQELFKIHAENQSIKIIHNDDTVDHAVEQIMRDLY